MHRTDDEDPPSTTIRPFRIVGVGASAGGLEAFTQLLAVLPPDTGMGFVLVQHLAPSHASALTEILSRATPMPVIEVQGEPTVEPNHVYVIPPGYDLTIAGGLLQLLPRLGGIPRPVDRFFRTLAEDQRHQAVGVVLSGTATDGTLGLEAIKAEGGITFAQDGTAQHDGMPRSAIASGSVDFVLSPEAIGRELVRIARHPYAQGDPILTSAGDEPNIASIIRLLRDATGIDFTHYKFNTLYRRITRRMLLKQVDGLTEYVRFLRQTPGEVDALYQDILINVTSFFRDPEAFEVLKTKVFPRLVQDRVPRDMVRFWALGCSTGEEAYSLAIAFTEFTEAAGIEVGVQIFASDISTTSLDAARAGSYSKDIAEVVSPERLRRFFVQEDGGYRVSKTIRDICIFSRHNVLADPPFSRMDLVSCRNLLIYLDASLQEKVLPVLHYALKPGGFLWLGGSETVGVHRNLFNVEDATYRVYAKRPGGIPGTGLPSLPAHPAARSPFTPLAGPAMGGGGDLTRDADRMLASRFAPPAVLVSGELDILQYRGDTGPYLAPAPGKASLNLLKMLREGLLVGVRTAVLRAGKEGVPVRQEGLRVRSNDGDREVAVEVLPIKGGGLREDGFLILFEEAGVESPRRATPEVRPESDTDAPGRASASEIARLEGELAATRDYLQSIIEQHEAANEELQSANEEIQSANEELQSSNEELETSKEEIQSSNEELATVNDELNNRNSDLHRLNNDLANLLGSVQVAIVMLGPDFRIRRFTAAAEKLLNLIPADIGRPVGDITFNFKHAPELGPLLTEVLETVSPRELDVQDRQGCWYSLRLRPYRTLDNRIDGVVLMLVDIDAMQRVHQRTASIVATVREPLLVLGADLRVQTASAAFYDVFQVTPDETIGRLLFDLGNRQWDIPALRGLLVDVLPRDLEVRNFAMEQEFEHLGRRSMLVNARRMQQVDSGPPGILLAIEDVTSRRQVEEALRHYARQLSEADRRKDEFLAMLAHELRNPLAPLKNALEIIKSSEGLGPDVASAAAVMTRQVGQMVRLVEDLLDVSRISHGTIELRFKRVRLDAVVRNVIEAARPFCEELRHQLSVSLPQEPLHLNADAARLSQVLGNLVINACKFTDPGGRIGLLVEREGDEAVIRVRDNGIGLAADQLLRIFDLFVQVDGSLTRTISGLGMGLSLVKQLVEQHGGTVRATSGGLRQGSEFVVRLPLAVDGAASLSEASAGQLKQAVPPRRILVVDDNQDSADSLARLLELKGHATAVAYDGLRVVETAAAFRPDVILLDIGLPHLSGYEVAQRVREQPWGRGIALIALTGWGQQEARDESHAAGFQAHLVKPVDFDMLVKMLAEIRAPADP